MKYYFLPGNYLEWTGLVQVFRGTNIMDLMLFPKTLRLCDYSTDFFPEKNLVKANIFLILICYLLSSLFASESWLTMTTAFITITDRILSRGSMKPRWMSKRYCSSSSSWYHYYWLSFTCIHFGMVVLACANPSFCRM